MATTWDLDAFDIPQPSNLSAEPTPLHQLAFNPLGLYDLRRHFGVFPHQPGFFGAHRSQFLASDVAWFAGGAGTDGNHRLPPDNFHPLFETVHRDIPYNNEEWKAMEKRVQAALFDLATYWDRGFGGSTIIMHVEGTIRPGCTPIAENLRAYTYLPAIVDELPPVHPHIVNWVNAFITHIGVPTARRWRTSAHNYGWALNSQVRNNPRPYPTTHRLPLPSPRSREYIFYGGVLNSAAPPPPPAPPIHMHTNVNALSDTLSATTLTDDSTAEREDREELILTIEEMDHEISELREENQDLMDQVTMLNERISELQRVIGQMATPRPVVPTPSSP
ncbi:hypothetical protein BDN72DRAFT_865160 [Pluteus cervinus]|uniref:Uncharacterized protein n=1 Tax=Pluteus cervinus TaxID=181527 RepID=A0ACD3A224_9AGAR|nr:hypothetical protein BDN72DRAFT_865160 [Pluteus cervinus]